MTADIRKFLLAWYRQYDGRVVVQETSQGLGEDGGVEYVSIGDDVAVLAVHHCAARRPPDSVVASWDTARVTGFRRRTARPMKPGGATLITATATFG
jgi:hypothetical protein